MKMKKNLIIWGIVLVVAVAVAIGASILLKNKKAQDAAQTSTEPAQTAEAAIKPLDIALADIESITVTRGESVIKINRAGENAFTIDGETQHEINSGACNVLMQNFTPLYASDKIENVESIGEYGMTEPYATISISAAGKTHVVKVGVMTPTAQSCYVMVDDDKTVYVASSMLYKYVSNDVASYYVIPTMSVTTADIRALRLEKNGEVVFALTSEIKAKSIIDWELTEPWHIPAEGQSLDTFCKKLEEILLSRAEKGSIEDEVFGFAAPSYKLTVKTDTNEMTLVFGNLNENADARYMHFEGEDKVYTITTNYLEILDTTTYTMAQKTFALLGINSVNDVIYTRGTTGFTLVITKQPVLDENGKQVFDDNGNAKTSDTFTLNGVKMDEAQSRYMYQYIIKLKANGIVEKQVDTTAPAASIVFNLSDSSKYECTFYDYDVDFYAVGINGSVNLLMRKDQLDEIETALSQYKDGTIQRPGVYSE